MFPIIGLFIFVIPTAGLIMGIGLFFFRRTRFLAPFAFLVPFVGGVCAVTGFFGLGIAAERVGLSRWLVALATWTGFFGGGALGGILGLGLGFCVLWMFRRIIGQMRKSHSSRV